MSAINNNNNAQSRLARRARSDYQKKEQDLNKKHGDEVKRLNNAHYKEVESIKKVHSNRMDDLKNRSKESLSQREQKFQKDTEGLRELHREKTRKVAAENDRNTRRLNNAKNSELEKYREISKRQNEMQKAKYDDNTTKVQRQFTNYVDRVEKEQREARIKQNKKVELAHDKKVQEILSNRDKKIAHLESEHNKSKFLKNTEIANLKNDISVQKERMGSDYFDQIQLERNKHEANLKLNQKAFNSANDRVRGRFEKATNNERLEFEAARKTLEETVHKRQDNQVKSLEYQVQHLKDSKTFGLEKQRKESAIEKQHIVDDFHKQVKVIDEQKKEMVEIYNEVNRKDISRISEENAKNIKETNRFYLNKIDDDNRRQEERLIGAVEKVEKERDHILERSELTEMKRSANYEDNRVARETYFKDALEILKDGYKESLNDIRAKNSEEKSKIINGFQQRMRHTLKDENIRNERKTDKYEREIKDLKARQALELKNLNKKFKLRYAEESTSSELEKSSMKAKYEDKLSQLNESHREESLRQEMQHQDELKEVLATIKKS